MIKVLKACLFDLDGVLVDTAKYHFLAWKRLADELNIPFSIDDNEQLKGVSRMRSLEIILELGKCSLSEGDKASLADKKNTWYVDLLSQMNHSELLPGVLELLDELKKHEIKIALGSASKNAMMILEKLGITGYFDAIVDGHQVERAKPDPEVFLLGAEKLSIPPYDCIVFEDAVAGIQAAQNAKMLAIGVGSEKILKRADYVVKDLRSLDYTFLKDFYFKHRKEASPTLLK